MTRDGPDTPQWEFIRAFLALQRHGSYEIAAELEGIDDSTLRRRIRNLEQYFGRALFVRSAGGWKASADAHALIEAAQRMEEAARSFCQNHQTGEGVIRISVMDIFAQRFASVFARLSEKYPGLLFTITTEAHFVNLEQDQVDIAVRLARPARNSNSLRVRRLGNVAIGAYASREYLERAGKNAQARHRLLAMNLQFFHQDHDFMYAQLDWSHFGVSGHVRLQSDSFASLARLCALGQGLALLPKFLAVDYPQLVAHPPDVFGDTQLWLVSRFDMHATWQRDLADMGSPRFQCNK